MFRIKLFFAIIILSGCSVLQPLQKRKLLGVFHLIENSRFTEAKIAAEELINDEETAQWPRTWYARGVLSQNAYREGIRRNDRRLTELYPDQLFVARESFDKALSLDKGGRMGNQLAPRYVLLANDFQALGERHFRGNRFAEALRAFEQALEISEMPMLAITPDTNLIFNSALAAFESRNWEKSVKYFSRLHNYGHSANVSHLLFRSYLLKGDTPGAKKALKEGIERFNYDKELVLLLVDLYVREEKTAQAFELLDRAIKSQPAEQSFHYTKGLILQRNGSYKEAIKVYETAIKLAPDNLMAHVNIATCYYNIGVEIDENTRTITNSLKVQEEKAKSAEAFASAILWLNKAYEKNPQNQEVLSRLYELYKLLRVSDKANALERRIK